MKAVRYFLAVLSFMAVLMNNNYLHAQCQPDWKWAKGIKGDLEDWTKAMAIDKWNNIYIGGETRSSKLYIDSLTMPGICDYFIKFNSSGKLLWAKRIGGNVYGIVTDKYGNVYITGLFWTSTITFEQITLTKTAKNTVNSFLVKYSPDGKAIWAKKAYTAQNGNILMVNSLAIDTSRGNIILSGSFGGDFIRADNVEFKHNTFTGPANTHAFFFVYDSTGNVKWGKSVYSKNASGYTRGDGISADDKGNIYMCGFFVFDMQADTFYRNGGDANGYVIKFDSSGKIKWIKNATQGYTFVKYIQIDMDYNVIASGWMTQPPNKIENNVYNFDGQAGLIMKIDSSGNIKWIKPITGSRQGQKDGWQYVFSTTSDAAGNIYSVGTYQKDSLIIDNHHFSKTGGNASVNEPFFLKLDKDGNFKWLQRVYQTDTNTLTATFGSGNYSKVVLDKIGGVYVLHNWSYYSSSTGKQGIIVGKDTIATIGSMDVFVGKITNNLETTIKSSNATCYGKNDGFAKLYIIGGAPPYQIQWSNSSNQQEQSLGAGFYKVTVTDANNCIYQDSVEITEPPQLNISVTTKPDSANLKKGEAAAIVTGGTPPYTYLWNDAANQKTAKAIGLAKGSYKITVTDKNGCTVDTTITITSLVDIDELFESRISVFPNPVLDGLLNIDIQQLPQNMQLSLYDGTGRELITKSIPSNTNYHDQLSISGKGIYILKIQMAGKKFIKSIVVQ